VGEYFTFPKELSRIIWHANARPHEAGIGAASGDGKRESVVVDFFKIVNTCYQCIIEKFDIGTGFAYPRSNTR
jgi:hypothetical protein